MAISYLIVTSRNIVLVEIYSCEELADYLQMTDICICHIKVCINLVKFLTN